MHINTACIHSEILLKTAFLDFFFLRKTGYSKPESTIYCILEAVILKILLMIGLL